MGFLSNIQPQFKPSKNSTKGFYIGTPEAEGENFRIGQNLKDFYEDYNDITDNIKNGKFIISGRKGTGKSAYVRYITENSSEERELYSALIKPSDYNLETCIQTVENELKFEIIFEWLILTRLVNLILKTHEGVATNEIQALQRFQDKNRGLIDIDKYMPLEYTNSTNFEINFAPLKDVFKPIISKNFSNKLIKAPFYVFIPSLREIICHIFKFQCLERFDFIIMFDDLDVKFKLSEKSHQEKLLDLIRIAKRYNCEYLTRKNTRILIFLRDDIGRRLGGIDSDKNKIFGSYENRINWYNYNDAKYDEKKLLLRKFINKRIGINFNVHSIPYNEEDPWVTLIDNSVCEAYNNKTAFKYILDFTFYRPRDLINFFNNIGSEDLPIPLSPDSIKFLLKKYTRSIVEELKDELTALFECDMIENIFDVLKDVAKSYTDPSYEQVLDFMENHDVDTKHFDTLIEYSLLNAKEPNGNKFYYNYREQYPQGCYEEYVYVLPRSLYVYFCPVSVQK